MKPEELIRPRLLKEIHVTDEIEIYTELQKLREKFPSYRDDQLFTFWLGKLKEEGVDITKFSSNVSFM